MKCHKCAKNAQIYLKYMKPVCRQCFCRIIERRIRKQIRLNSPFNNRDILLVTDDLSAYFIKKLFEMPLKTVNKKIQLNMDKRAFTDKKLQQLVKKHKITKIILPWTADDENAAFLDAFFAKKSLKEQKKFVKLFLPVTEDELALYCKFKKLKKPVKKTTLTRKILDDVEKKNPGIKFSLLKSIKKLNEISEKSSGL